MPFDIRPAEERDAAGMARILNRIIAIGGTTAHRGQFDEHRIIDTFIAPPLLICCHVAADQTGPIGFQCLEWCDPDWPGPDTLPEDWAVIATFVDPGAHRRGLGRALFDRSAEAARAAGVRFIDATIRKENLLGQAYYQGLGFTDYRVGDETVSKRYRPG